MDPISSQGGMGPQMYALKKAINSQEQGIMKLLENIPAPSVTSSSPSAELTGLGQNLDISA